jgi:hypothetical protein
MVKRRLRGSTGSASSAALLRTVGSLHDMLARTQSVRTQSSTVGPGGTMFAVYHGWVSTLLICLCF